MVIPERADGSATVIGVFDDPRQAEEALTELRSAGFLPDDVSVVVRDTRVARASGDGTVPPVAGPGSGAALGGLAGAVAGGLAGLGALVVPGVGPIVAAGALALALSGAVVGAVGGGLLGALLSLGVSEDDARAYEERVRQGSLLLAVTVRSAQQAQQARSIFDRHGSPDARAYGVNDLGTAYARTQGPDEPSDEAYAGFGQHFTARHIQLQGLPYATPPRDGGEAR